MCNSGGVKVLKTVWESFFKGILLKKTKPSIPGVHEEFDTINGQLNHILTDLGCHG